MLRIVNGLLGLMMLSFVAVQWNDPDGPLWMAIYLVPAVWALLAAFRCSVFRSQFVLGLLWASVLFGASAMIYYWPTVPGFWRKEVWWVEETAREGMGVMILFVVLLVVLVTAYRQPAR